MTLKIRPCRQAPCTEHGILLFRNQKIDPEKQIEFSRIFGPLELHPLKATTSEANPELFVLENGGEKDKFFTATYHGEEIVGRLDWHIDLRYTGRPNHGAYDTLDDSTKQLLEKIEIAYSFSMQRKHMRYVDLEGYQPGPFSPGKPSDMNYPDFPDAVYPGVRRVINRTTIEGGVVLGRTL